MKKSLLLGLLLFVFMGMFFVYLFSYHNSDAGKFKKEYESINGERLESGKVVRSINIPGNNPMKYASEEDIIRLVNEKESFVVYFGFARCPWCRSVIPNLIRVAGDLNIDTIYYVDVLDIRDTLMVDNDGKVSVSKKGSDGYYQLLSIFGDVLSDYTLSDDNDKEVTTGEKRIYAPNIVSVVNGKVQDMTTGISKKQTDGYMKLTSEMNQESYQMIKCSIQCVVDAKKVCSAKSMC